MADTTTSQTAAPLQFLDSGAAGYCDPDTGLCVLPAAGPELRGERPSPTKEEHFMPLVTIVGAGPGLGLEIARASSWPAERSAASGRAVTRFRYEPVPRTLTGVPTYTGLILDFGGVVTTDFFGALDAFSERTGIGQGAFLRAFRDHPEGRQALKAVEKGELPQREFERIIGAILGVDDKDLLKNALGDLEPRPEVIDVIRRARAKGIRLAALSNSLGAGDYDAYAEWALDELFDVVVISHQVGLRKPHPKIFALTAGQLGLPPSACLFVDDTAHNLTGAASLGMGTLHFTGAESELAEIDRLLGLA